MPILNNADVAYLSNAISTLAFPGPAGAELNVVKMPTGEDAARLRSEKQGKAGSSPAKTCCRLNTSGLRVPS
jgi:hypothetical protein